MKLIAVIGSGIMGCGIAAHIANSKTHVLLFDIASSPERNSLAKAGMANMLNPPSALTDAENINYITPCNLEDDLEKLKDVDWVVEVIIEKLDIKKELYAKLLKYISPNCIISSNTSTITLSDLVDGFDENFKTRFLITHFFNPVRHMRLLEIVRGNAKELQKIHDFCDINLGKEIIYCNDTPGFIANRIGCYFLITGLEHAVKSGIPINELDHILSQYFGIPKTGIFGLFDLIGIDVMDLISNSLIKNLNSNDDFVVSYKSNSVIKELLSRNYKGRKSGGGFYKFDKETKKRKIINLNTFEYIDEPALKELNAKNIVELFESDEVSAKVVKKIILNVLNYTINLLGIITEDITSIDQAMKLGFNWKYGIFELIDKISTQGANNKEYLKTLFKENNFVIPDLLNKIDGVFYKEDKYYYNEGYRDITKALDKINIENLSSPIFENDSLKLWDLGDEIICLELTSKMSVLDNDIFEGIIHICQNILKNYRGMVLSSANKVFSAGANLRFLLDLGKSKKYTEIENFIKFGQSAMLELKNSQIPIIAAAKNLALGGGCELIMHSHSAQSYIELYTGLVEVNVGLIPAWGGCSELILRARNEQDIINGFSNILFAKISQSAQESIRMNITNDNITMNIDRLISDAKNLVINYKPINTNNLNKNFEVKPLLNDLLEQSDKLSAYDKEIGKCLIEIFSGRNKEEIMKLELEVFLELIKNKITHDRIEYMINNGKPLK